ncbi:hypothetical protein Pcinc_025585 [Petrolisthes cinctipes]|uniref:cardiolipin synthase (CMP-forming) n=1 Tax=Petrolisthes cinctipes TaxID=88211 RepID=A0AAE1F897_PETCI|nr:hypothetical protein Pcinc_025585 [Petrolisthes cinctipes]
MAAHMISSALSKALVFNERLAPSLIRNSIQDIIQPQRKTRNIHMLTSEVYSTARLSDNVKRKCCTVLGVYQRPFTLNQHQQHRHQHQQYQHQTSPHSSHLWTVNGQLVALCGWRRSRWIGGIRPWWSVESVTTCFTTPPSSSPPPIHHTAITTRSLSTSEAHHKTVDTSEQSRNVASWEVVKKERRIRDAGKDLIDDFKETKAKVREKMDEIIERENIWTIPNLLCVSRICLSPVLSYMVLCSNYHWGLALFMFAGFTDLLDGWIARTFPSQASNLGSFLDPLADKVLVAVLFLSLTYVGLIPLPLTGLIIYRDVLIIGGASFVRYKSLPPPCTISRYFDATHATARLAPTAISKINTAVQLGLITASLAAPVFSCTDHIFIKTLWWLTAATTLCSGFSYIFSRDTYKFLSTMEKHREK